MLVYLGVAAAADALHGAGGRQRLLQTHPGSSRHIQAPADLHLNSEPIDQLSAPVASLSPQDHTQRIHIGRRALNHFPGCRAQTLKDVIVMMSRCHHY